MALMSNANTFVPQMSENESALFEKIESSGDSLWLPDSVTQDILGIVIYMVDFAAVIDSKLGQTQKNILFI